MSYRPFPIARQAKENRHLGPERLSTLRAFLRAGLATWDAGPGCPADSWRGSIHDAPVRAPRRYTRGVDLLAMAERSCRYWFGRRCNDALRRGYWRVRHRDGPGCH